ncbi:MAG TPA: metalloregulator ArsR/SmtB family transcription factor [Xanthobacteraceae bacterium]|nr:metalloregulator ArsR/SmtB family transcription factor [Xanthobacteraceae bacterium]
MDARTPKTTTRSRPAKPAGKKRAGTRGSELEQLAVQAASAARMLKLLGNEYRLLILCALAARGEMRVGELVDMVGLSQSALSQHLSLLREDGLVAFRREAQTLYYRISDPRAARILKLLKDIYCGDLA